MTSNSGNVTNIREPGRRKAKAERARRSADDRAHTFTTQEDQLRFTRHADGTVSLRLPYRRAKDLLQSAEHHALCSQIPHNTMSLDDRQRFNEQIPLRQAEEYSWAAALAKLIDTVNGRNTGDLFGDADHRAWTIDRWNRIRSEHPDNRYGGYSL